WGQSSSSPVGSVSVSENFDQVSAWSHSIPYHVAISAHPPSRSGTVVRVRLVVQVRVLNALALVPRVHVRTDRVPTAEVVAPLIVAPAGGAVVVDRVGGVGVVPPHDHIRVRAARRAAIVARPEGARVRAQVAGDLGGGGPRGPA